MSCPLCKHELQKHTVESKHGDQLPVYHCGQCGGTWFDASDIHRIPHHEIVRIADVTVKPKTPHYTSHEFFCPNDHKNLTRYHSETAPLGVSFYHCTRCHGIWATQHTSADIVHTREQAMGQTDPEPSPAHAAYPIVFVPTIALLFLLISTFFTIRHIQDTKDNQTRAIETIRATHITQLSPTMAVLTFDTNTPLNASITYGTSVFDSYSKDISNVPTMHHRIILTDLKTQAIYKYTLTIIDDHGSSYTTPTYIFTTGQ
jgi:Zn-finger nucleic acid-binding protein